VDTFVGSGGSQLSGGQKQRIAISRILLKDCKMILMDEATSALDRKSESMLLKTFRDLQSDFMSISITHRKKVLSDCDKVYKFRDKGSVTIVTVKDQFRLPGSLLRSNTSDLSSDLLRSPTMEYELLPSMKTCKNDAALLEDSPNNNKEE
jgi:energy-coupling factor transporter ATP-binding protein EcfA2